MKDLEKSTLSNKSTLANSQSMQSNNNDDVSVSSRINFRNANELRQLGFDPVTLRLAGFNDIDILTAGFAAEQLRSSGFGSISSLVCIFSFSYHVLLKIHYQQFFYH